MKQDNPTSSVKTQRFLPPWLGGRWGVLAVFFTVYLLVYLAWIQFYWGDEGNGKLIGDLFYFPVDHHAADGNNGANPN